MRNAIRTQILNNVSEITEVWQPGMAGKDVEKPYAVVKYNGEFEGNIRKSYDRTIEVWVYTDRITYNTIDSIIENVIDCLTNQVITTDDDFEFTLTCNGVSPDGYFDKDLEAVGKFAAFTFPLLRR